MILPCPEDLRSYVRYPLTLTLIGLNLFIFILIFSGASSTMSSSPLLKEDSLVLTGRLYFQYLKTLPAHELFNKPDWYGRVASNDRQHLILMGSLALRDSKFMKTAELGVYHGDAIQIQAWRTAVTEFKQKFQRQLLFRFGLSSENNRLWTWITYQFSHSGLMHLLSNLLFLAALGAAVERLAGSGSLLLIYILGGFLGAAGFLLMDPQGTVPMVGASGSISALLAFYCFAESRKRVRFVYFVSPMPGHYGAIFLPTLLMIPLFLLADISSLLSHPTGLGSGVAYAAHLGGALFGVLAGLLFRFRAVYRFQPF